MSIFKSKEKIITVIFIILTLCIVLPVVCGSGYTYLCEDDFSFEAGANDMARIWNSGLVGGLVRAYEYYMSTQGTYVFNSVINLTRAYTRWGIIGFHVFMIVINVAFAWSLYYLIKALFKIEYISMGIMFAASYAVYQSANSGINRELFYWYTGSINFTLGLTLSFLSLGLCLNYLNASKEKTGWKYLVFSAIIAFFASGTALEIVSPHCAFLLAVIIMCYPRFKEDKKVVLPFLSAFAGALVNVLAPGNYPKTYDNMSEGHVTVLDAFRDTVVCYINETKKILGSPVFIILLITVFLICYILKVKIITEKLDFIHIIITTVGSFLVQFFTMFPVCFGYHSDSLIEQRTTAAYELVARLMYLFAVICIAQWLWEMEKKLVTPVVFAAFLAICVLCIWRGDIKEDIKSGFSYMTFCDLRDGSMRDAYNMRSYVMSALELAEDGTDAVIVVPMRAHPKSVYGMGIQEDPNEFVNVSAAGLYHLNSVSVIYTD